MASYSHINSVKVRISTNAEQRLAPVEVVEKSTFINGKPVIHGLADPGFGPYNDTYNCTTCKLNQKQCSKHSGVFIINYPIFDPKYVSEIGNWLKILCPWCSMPIVDPKKVPGIFGSPNKVKHIVDHLKLNYSRLQRKKIKGETNFTCANGHERRHIPIYVHEKKYNRMLFRFYRIEDEMQNSNMIPPHLVKEIFDKIPPEIVQFLGKGNHPSEYIRTQIQIPAMNIRASSFSIMHSQENQNDAIHTLPTLIGDAKDELGPRPQETLDSVLSYSLKYEGSTWGELFDRRAAIYDNYSVYLVGKTVIKKKGSPMKIPGLSAVLLGKGGFMRLRRQGNRFHGRGRAVIVCAADISVKHVMIPYYMAVRMRIKETVTAANYERLYGMLCNRGTYPSVVEVITKSGVTYDVTKAKDTFMLNIGDEVLRHMVDGDIVTLNRTPSLALASFVNFIAIINLDQNNHSMGFNQSVCAGYNADFDGDQMMATIPNHEASRVECESLATSANLYIDERNGKPRLYLSQDDMTHIAELSRSDLKYTKNEVMDFLKNVRVPFSPEWHGAPLLTKVSKRSSDQIYTGHEIISFVLPIINYRENSAIGKSPIAQYMNLNPSDKEVVIENGIAKSGIFDSAILGGSTRSILHHTYLVYGVDITITLMTNLQTISLNYATLRCFTYSMLDYYLAEEVEAEIQNRVRGVMMESDILTERLYAGNLVPPRGMSVMDYFEQQTIQYLQADYLDIIVKNLGYSHLVRMIAYGAKGKLDNLSAVCGSIGQSLVDGHRPKKAFANSRASIFSHQYDLSLTNSGFCPDSYINGAPPKDYFMDSMRARYSICKKGIETAQAGAMGRMFQRVHENVSVNHYGLVFFGKVILQLAFGDCDYDPRRVHYVKIPGIVMSDVEFRSKFRYEAKGEYQKLFDQEYDELFRQRKRCIRVLLRHEIITGEFNSNIDKRHLPVDIDVVIESLQFRRLENPVDIKTLLEMKYQVTAFVKRIPYLRYSQKYWDNPQLQEEVPNYVLGFHSYFIYYVQLVLCSKRIQYYSPEMLTELLMIVQYKFCRALTEAGDLLGSLTAITCGERATQASLNAIHAIGAGAASAYTLNETREFIKGTNTTKSGSAKMLIRVKPQHEKDQLKVREIVSRIQFSAVADYHKKAQIFYEEFGHPVHPKYMDEIEIYKKFQSNTVRPIPSNFEPFCFRIELDIEKLLDRNIRVSDIAQKLQSVHSEIFIVASYETNEKFGPILRIHMTKTASTKFLSDNKARIKYLNNLLSTPIRGIPGISFVTETKTSVHRLDEDGKISHEEVYIITARGSNIIGIGKIPEIDFNLSQSSSALEVQKIFGLAAARTKIAIELSKMIKDISPLYYSMMASLMTCTGSITGISPTGNIRREPTNVFGNMTTGLASGVLIKAANDSIESKLYGTSGPTAMGQPMEFGTNYSKIVLDMEMIKANKHLFKKEGFDEVLDELDDIQL